MLLKKLKQPSSQPKKIVSKLHNSIKSRIIFSKMSSSFYFRKKKVMSRIMFMLSVQSIEEFPRPYSLRIFTFEHSLFPIDIHQVIYNQDKMFYENNQHRLPNIINVLSQSEMEIIEDRANEKLSRESKSRYSISSDFSSGMSESSIIPKKAKHKSLRRSRVIERFKRTSSIQTDTLKDLPKWLDDKGPSEGNSDNSSSNSSNGY